MDVTIFIVTLALMFGAYAICGIPFGYIISKRTAGVDVTKQGSGNIGMTNVARTVGVGAGAATLALDALKGLICVVISRLVIALMVTGGDTAPLEPQGPLGWCLSCVFLACVCGHIFSPYMGFKGGKGIACGFGAAIGLSWPIGLIILAVFLIVALPSHYVSAGSLAASVAFPVAAAVLYWPVTGAAVAVGPTGWLYDPWAAFWGFEIPLILAALCAIWAHRVNMHRLIHGEESEFHVANEEEAAAMERRYDYTTDDVEEASLEAAERDAKRPPRAGVTYTFGDEGAVSREVREAEDDVAALDEDVDALERELEGEPRGDDGRGA